MIILPLDLIREEGSGLFMTFNFSPTPWHWTTEQAVSLNMKMHSMYVSGQTH